MIPDIEKILHGDHNTAQIQHCSISKARAKERKEKENNNNNKI
jgi:hypothetical protein